MKKEIKQRLKWIKMYEQCGNAGLVCLRCGISRPTLRKWWKRYLEKGEDGLESLSRRPKTSPFAKVGIVEEDLILQIRKTRNLGARRIQSELKRLYGLALSTATIHKVLSKNAVKPIHTYRSRKVYTRYSRPLPGDRIQMDTCKIGPGFYQYTAVDDCTRYRVLRLYSRRTAANTVDFIENVLEEMPFPIQRIQTDRGTEFFAYRSRSSFMTKVLSFVPTGQPRRI